MTADPKRRRGRPPTPPQLIGIDPFSAPSLDRVRWKALVTALAEVRLPVQINGGCSLGQALAEQMFPRDEWQLYCSSKGTPREQELAPNFDGHKSRKVDACGRRFADERGPEAVERWLLHRQLLWLQAIDTNQRAGLVRDWGRLHARLATAMEAFAEAPHDVAAAEAAACLLSCLPPDPVVPGQSSPLPDADRLTPERLKNAFCGDPAERAATAGAAAELAVDCRRLMADVEEWLQENETSRGRRALARTVAAVVADLFDAVGAGKHVRFARGGGAATGTGAANAYCRAVEATLDALGMAPPDWRRAAEDVARARAVPKGES